MEAAGAAAGKAVVNVLLGGAKGAVAADSTAKQGVQRDLPFLKEELAAMQSFLMAADEERNKNKVHPADVTRVRTLVYDVEDCIQEAFVHLEKPSWWQLPNTMGERQRIAEEMKRLRAQIEDMDQRSLRYQIAQDPNSKSATSATTARRAAASDKPEVNRMVQLINSEASDLKVIAVWGTSDNLEQTSIVRAAYENPAVIEKFPCRAWVRVMQPFNPIEFAQSLVRQFQSAVGFEALLEAEKPAQQLTQEFNQHVGENGYLIVLNDLNTIEEWDRLKTCFPNNKKGSRIIVSTKQAEVATLSVGYESAELKLKQLSADQILYAFHDKACHKTNGDDRGISLLTSERWRAPYVEPYLVLQEKQTHDIIKAITNENSNLQVISVWGIRGIGKTTLVRHIYRNQELSGKFQKHAFVTIVQPFVIREFLTSLIMQLDEGKYRVGQSGRRRKTFLMMPLGELIKELNMLSQGLRCLIVIDGVLSSEDWDMTVPFLYECMHNSSKIIVTTREEFVAMYCSKEKQNIHKLALQNQIGRDLFIQKVFGRPIDLEEEYPDLVEQADLILSKCNGVPLAIVAMGVLLANQPKIMVEWTKLNDHICAELEKGRDLLTVMLSKIYDGIPYHLKSCILYLPIFPKDYKVSRRRLIRRWTAEGYSQESRDKSAEETADTYFMELVSKSMILPCQSSIDTRQGIDSCELPGLISEIAMSKSSEENLVFKLEEGCSQNTRDKVRHLAVTNSWKGDQSELERMVDMSRLRSMTVFGEWRSFFSLNKMKLLRVLDLEDTTDLVDHHLEHIGKLLHLRYLSLRGCCDIYHLPDSLGNLRQLETLDVKGTKIVELPKTISKLTKLQHVLAGYVAAEDDDIYEAVSEGLPKLMRKLCLKARGRITGGVAVPRGINKLKVLHTLATVNVSGWRKTALQDIKGFTRLRKLGVAGINRGNGQELCSAVTHLRCLESLSMWSDGKQGFVNCLEGTFLFPEKLQRLGFYGMLVRLPEWIQGLRNLVKLKLRGSRLYQHDDTMQVLGQLPNLAILILLENTFEGEELHVSFRNKPFPSLVVLQLQSQDVVRRVEFDEEATPRLEVLRFGASSDGGCLFSGLQHVRILREVALGIVGPNKEYIAEKMREQLAMHPNRPVVRMGY